MPAMRLIAGPRILLIGFGLVCTLVAQTVPPPRVSGIGGGGSVDLGQRVVLTPIFSGGSGSASLQYQWRKNGADLAAQTRSNLVIEAVTATDAGTFAVVVSNSAGSSVASTELTVKTPAPPVITTQPRAATVDAGQTAGFNVGATGSFPRTYQWRKDGVDLPGATAAVLTRVGVTTADVGIYSVQISNAYGSVVSSSAALNVNAARPPTMGSFTPNVGLFIEGRRVSITAPVSGGSMPFTFQWRKDGTPVPGASDAALTFDAITLSDAGMYSVRVANIAGEATSAEVQVVVEPAKPPFKIRLRNQPLIVGQTFTLQDTDSLFEQQPTTYQWYKDGHALPQATDLRHTIDKADGAAAGAYFVVATNLAGSTTSDTAIVSVLETEGPIERAWLAAARSGDIVYFLFANPARLARFDLASDAWLPSLALPRTPTAFTVEGDAIYVAFGPVLSRFALDGSGEAPVTAGFLYEIRGLCASNGFLFAFDGNGQVTSVRASDGAKVSSLPYSRSLYPPTVVARTPAIVFGRNGSHSGSLIGMKVQPDGSLAELPSQSNLKELPYGERLFLSPDEQTVIGHTGRTFRASDLELKGSLGSSFNDLDFTATGEAVVLRGQTLHIHETNLYESRRLTADRAGLRVFVRGGDAFVFGAVDASGTIPKTRVSLGSAASLPVAGPLSPQRLGFTPDFVTLDRDEVVLLYSKIHRQIFRWSTVERRFLSSIPLRGWPNRIAYSPALHRIHVAYADNRLSQIKLDAGATHEEPFVTVPQQIISLASAGEFVGVDFSDSIYSNVRRLYFSGDGRQFDAGGGYSLDYTWSSANRRLYHFRDNSSPNDLLYTEIKPDLSVGQRKDSPYHGEIQTTYPIRVSPDGSTVLLGSGKFFDGNTLAVINSLPHAIEDAQWVNNRVVTGRTTSRGLEIQRWSGNAYSLDRTTVLSGRLIRLLALSGHRTLAVTVTNGLVHFTTLDQELGIVSRDFVGQPERLANISSRAVVGREDRLLIPGFVIAGEDPKTLLIRAVGPGLDSFGVPGVLSDPVLSIHNAAGAVVATNDNWSSGTSTNPFLGLISSRVGAFGLSRGSRDAATLVTLDPGAYTVQVRGAGDTTGVALVEVYDPQDNAGSGRLVNIATRAEVGTEGDILIAGVVVQSDTPKSVLIRAVGPTLSAFGVDSVLANPRLRVFRDGRVIAENGDWGEGGAAVTAEIATAAARAGAFALPVGTLDSALLLSLPAGSYSVQVSGTDGGTGVALVEVYEVP